MVWRQLDANRHGAVSPASFLWASLRIAAVVVVAVVVIVIVFGVVVMVVAVAGDVGDRGSGLAGQLPHRTDDPMIKDYDTDFPEPGENPEHSGAPIAQVDQDPGERQKENQGKKKDDPLAA